MPLRTKEEEEIMKIGDIVYKIIDLELRTCFVVEVKRSGYRIQTKQEPSLVFFIPRKSVHGAQDEMFLSRIVGLSTLEERLSIVLVKVRKDKEEFRKKYLGVTDLDKEAFNYTEEEIYQESKK